MKDLKIKKLSKDESGKLIGGFEEKSTGIDTNLGASNGNCTGGGWFDTNTNCTGTCSKCNVSSGVLTNVRR